MFLKKYQRFLYLTYRLTKLFLDYKSMYDENKPESLKEFAIHTRKTFEELGPTFIKLGQMLSLRFDLLPMEVCREFRKLLDHDPRISFKEVKQIIETELHSPLNKNFSHFEKEPIAAASLAQVHRAVLKNGQEVAVKVLKPHVKEIMLSDIEVLFDVVRLLSLHPVLRRLNPVDVVNEFAEWTKKEMNFVNEADSMERYAKNFSSFDFVKVPKVYWNYTTQHVLTYEFLEGITLNELITSLEKKDEGILSKLKKMNFDLKKFVPNISKVILKQTFEDGFFHADPHPANIILMENNKIGVIDFGIMGELSDAQLTEMFLFMLAFVERDVDTAVNLALKLGKADETTNIPLLKAKIRALIDELRGKTIGEIKSVELFNKTFSILTDCKLKVPAEYTSMAKQLATLDGIADLIAPDYNLLEEFKPYSFHLTKKQLKEKISKRKILQEVSNLLSLAEELPKDLDEILDRLREGRIVVTVRERSQQERERSTAVILLLVLISVFLGIIFGSRMSVTLHAIGVYPDKRILPIVFIPIIFIVLYFFVSKKLYPLKSNKK